MPRSLIPSDNEMRLPELKAGVCVNHPDRKAVEKHLCAECFNKWKVDVARYDTFSNTFTDTSE